MKKPHKHNLSQLTKVNLGPDEYAPFIREDKKDAFVVFLSQTHNPSSIMRKTSDKSQLEIFYKIPGEYSSRL